MAEARMDALIRQYDESVQYRQKLADYQFAGELLSIFQVLPMRTKKQVIDATQLCTTNECKSLKEYCLEIVHDEFAKSCIKLEDGIGTEHYQVSLKNNHHLKEFIDFANFLITRSKSNENVNAVLKSENNNLRSELEALKLLSLTLNSNLEQAHKSLTEKNSQRVPVRMKGERNNFDYLIEKLCSLSSKYQQKICQTEDMKETTTRAHCNDLSSMIESDSDLVLRIDTSTSEDSLDENNLSDVCGYYDESLISPPSGFTDDDIPSVKKGDLREFFLNKSDYAETNTFDETFNLSVRRQLQKRVPKQNSNYSANNLESSLSTPVNDLPMQTDVVFIEMDHYLPSVEDAYNANSPVNDSELIAIKNSNAVDALENTFIVSSMRKLPDPLKTNENLALSKTLSGCNQILTSRAVELSNLKISTAPEKSHFECDTCGKSFPKKIGIIAHVCVHMKCIQSFHCEKCNESFPTKNGDHELEKCPICDQNGDSHDDKSERTITIEASEVERSDEQGQICDNSKKCQKKVSDIRCIICNKHYSSKFVLNRHIRVVHYGEKPYECNECGKRFAEKNLLKTHISAHGSKKPFKCSVCKVGFTAQSCKIKHERVVHEGCAHFQCAHCDKRFGQKSNLIYHVHTKHFSGFQKQFKCTICDKSFALKHALQSHKFTHMSKRSFKCSVCDRYFKSPQVKTRHEKTVHGKGARFRCKHCDKLYKHKAFLIRHLRKDHLE